MEKWNISLQPKLVTEFQKVKEKVKLFSEI